MRSSYVSYQPATRRRGANVPLLFLTVPYPLVVLALSAFQAWQPHRNGLLALAEVFAAFFFFPLLLFVPFLFVRGMGLFRLVMLGCALLYAARFMPHLQMLPPTEAASERTISTLSWNVAEGGDAEAIHSLLLSRPADIVALVEAHVGEIESDPEIGQVYPYHYGPSGSKWDTGVVLLSAYPIIDSGVVPTSTGDSLPVAIWSRVDLGGGSELTAVVAHPLHGLTCGRKLPLPTCYDTTERDQLLVEIHSFVEGKIQQGDSLLLMGDFNITEREPGYHDLSAGLVDAYKEAGSGLGNSWSPNFLLKGKLARLRFPILRIDYQFSSPNLQPNRLSYDCTPRGSDHCVVHGSYRSR